MSDLDIQIQEYAEEGYSAYDIAERLEIPVDWVYVTLEHIE